MKKILSIARWEYTEKIKNKAFLISIFLTPAIIIFFTIAPVLISVPENESTSVYGVVDTSGIYFHPFKQHLEKHLLKNQQPKFICLNYAAQNKNINEIRKSVDKLIASNNIQGCLYIFNGGSGSEHAELRMNNNANPSDKEVIEADFHAARVTSMLSSLNIPEKYAELFNKNVSIKVMSVNSEGTAANRDFTSLFFSSFILIMLLIMMILSSGGMLVRSLLEEKSNRLIEILISSCSMEQLLSGKILALAGLGLTQLAVWAAISLMLNRFDVIPPETFINIAPMLIYFTLGYIFYTAVFVGVGSIVSTEQEAQQMTSYISLALILPTVFVVSAIQYPGSTLLKVLSYIPFTSTSVMLLRLKIENVSPIEIALTAFMMVFSIYAMILISSRIFKIGILSYGKRPSLKELFHWISGR